MRVDKFTNPLQQALSEAQSMALGRNHNFIEPQHLLLALLEQTGGACQPLLAKAGANLSQLRGALRKSLDKTPEVTGGDADVHLSRDLTRVFNQADKLSQQRGDAYLSSELVVLAMLSAKLAVADILHAAGVDEAVLNRVIDELRG